MQKFRYGASTWSGADGRPLPVGTQLVGQLHLGSGCVGAGVAPVPVAHLQSNLPTQFQEEGCV